MSWYLKALKQYVDFGGRARRKEFWFYTLFNFIFALVFLLIDNALGSSPILYVIYVLGTLLPSLAVAVRRLHDTGRSGLWLFIILIPLVGALVLIVFYVLESQPNSNKWGHPPLPNPN